jgi:hypothetical protein
LMRGTWKKGEGGDITLIKIITRCTLGMSHIF